MVIEYNQINYRFLYATATTAPIATNKRTNTGRPVFLLVNACTILGCCFLGCCFTGFFTVLLVLLTTFLAGVTLVLFVVLLVLV